MRATTQERAVRVVSGALVGSDLTPADLADIGDDLSRGGEFARLLGALLVQMSQDLKHPPSTRRDAETTRTPSKRKQNKKAGAVEPVTPDPFIEMIEARTEQRR